MSNVTSLRHRMTSHLLDIFPRLIIPVICKLMVYRDNIICHYNTCFTTFYSAHNAHNTFPVVLCPVAIYINGFSALLLFYRVTLYCIIFQQSMIVRYFSIIVSDVFYTRRVVIGAMLQGPLMYTWHHWTLQTVLHGHSAFIQLSTTAVLKKTMVK